MARNRSMEKQLAECQNAILPLPTFTVSAGATPIRLTPIYPNTLIPHSELLKSVARRVVDRKVLRLIKMWLKAPIEERDEDGTRRMSSVKVTR